MSSHVLTLFKKAWGVVREAIIAGHGASTMPPPPHPLIDQAEHQAALAQVLQGKAIHPTERPRYVEPVFDWTKVSYDPARGLVTERVKRPSTRVCLGCGAAVSGPGYRCSEHCLNGRD